MATPRQGCAAVALDEFRIMVAGGSSTKGSDQLSTTEILDVRTMAFAPGPTMGSARWECAAVAVDAQHVLIIGGEDSTDTVLATTELLDVATMAFSAGPDMRTARQGSVAVRLDAAGEQPRILVVGGKCMMTDDASLGSDDSSRLEGEYTEYLSTTEVLAVEDAAQTRAPRRRQ
jgi:hypothetical protein